MSISTGSSQAITSAVQAAQANAQAQPAAQASPGVTITPTAAAPAAAAPAAQSSAQPAAQAPQVEMSLAEMGVTPPKEEITDTAGTLGYLAGILANPKVAASSMGSRVDSAFQQLWNSYQQMYAAWPKG